MADESRLSLFQLFTYLQFRLFDKQLFVMNIKRANKRL